MNDTSIPIYYGLPHFYSFFSVIITLSHKTTRLGSSVPDSLTWPFSLTLWRTLVKHTTWGQRVTMSLRWQSRIQWRRKSDKSTWDDWRTDYQDKTRLHLFRFNLSLCVFDYDIFDHHHRIDIFLLFTCEFDNQRSPLSCHLMIYKHPSLFSDFVWFIMCTQQSSPPS